MCVLGMYSKCVFGWKRLLTVQEVVYSTWHWIMDDMQMSTPDSWRFKGTEGFFFNSDDDILPSGGAATFYPFSQ